MVEIEKQGFLGRPDLAPRRRDDDRRTSFSDDMCQQSKRAVFEAVFAERVIVTFFCASDDSAFIVENAVDIKEDNFICHGWFLS